MSLMIALHRAGAEIAGVHGEAWMRMRSIDHDLDGILARVSALHASSGRRVTPGDLLGTPTPICAGGDLPPEPGITPGAHSRRTRRPLTHEERARVQSFIARHGSVSAAHRHLVRLALRAGIAAPKNASFDRARNGMVITGAAVSALLRLLDDDARMSDGEVALDILRSRVVIGRPMINFGRRRGRKPQPIAAAS